MAHGAPDHVRMGDVNLLDYTDQVFPETNYNIGNGETKEFINEPAVGCLGLISYYGDYPGLWLKVHIDGVNIFNNSPLTLFAYNVHSGKPVSDYYGIGKYDEVNDRYQLWVDYRYQMSFKNRLKIEIRNASGVNQWIWNLSVLWKKRG